MLKVNESISEIVIFPSESNSGSSIKPKLVNI